MKRSLAILFILVMIVSCMPVMASTGTKSADGTDKAVTVQAKSGWVVSNKRWMYYVNGRALKDTAKKIGTYYYGFDKDGYLCTGFFNLHGKTYYGSNRVGAKKCGAILRGYYHIGDGYYYFNPAKYGALAKGFVKFGGKLYFFSSKDGKQRRTKGWFYHGSAMYYVKSDGTIATNTTIDGYKIGANGAVTDVNGMDKKAQGYSSSTRYLILVNKGKHLVSIYTGSKGSWSAVKRNVPCTTGKRSTPSPSGSFRLDHKSHKGPYGYKDFKASTAFYATRISAGNYFHSILYRLGCRNPYTHSPKDATLGKSRSNSCIRLPLDIAKYIHQVTPTGTRVIVY